jgi:hypothetical protein
VLLSLLMATLAPRVRPAPRSAVLSPSPAAAR